MSKNKNLYLIALLPPPDIQEEVQRIKEDFRDRFGAAHALKLPGHITLHRPFWAEHSKELQLKSFLETFAKEQDSFEVNLEGFDSFPPRVIFIKILNHEPFFRLFGSFRKSFPEKIYMDKSQKQTGIHPHMTIATRDLKAEIFPEALKFYQSKPYSSSFQAKGLSLFKHDGKRWGNPEFFKFK